MNRLGLTWGPPCFSLIFILIELSKYLFIKYKGKGMEAPSQPQVVVVGEEFLVGAAGNAEIDLMLGHKTVLCGDRAIRGDDGYEIAPDYCSDEALTREKLADVGIYPIVLPTEDAGKRPSKTFDKGYVALIPFGDGIALTTPLKTECQALACALWFALSDK